MGRAHKCFGPPQRVIAGSPVPARVPPAPPLSPPGPGTPPVEVAGAPFCRSRIGANTQRARRRDQTDIRKTKLFSSAKPCLVFGRRSLPRGRKRIGPRPPAFSVLILRHPFRAVLGVNVPSTLPIAYGRHDRSLYWPICHRLRARDAPEEAVHFVRRGPSLPVHSFPRPAEAPDTPSPWGSLDYDLDDLRAASTLFQPPHAHFVLHHHARQPARAQ